MTELSLRRLLTESLPVPVVLAFWSLLAWVSGDPDIASGLRLAGIVMVTLYVVVRGVQLAQVRTVEDVETDPTGVLQQNLRVAAAAGVWFLGALAVSLLEVAWDAFVRVGVFTSPADALVFLFVGAGVGTVVLYAVTVGTSVLRAELPLSTPQTDD